ncbi:2-C-methyl-D-erythritol 4-phosphate cytidylyltransferase [Pseudarthrobacter sp. J64]|uniref:2-C-methyl-D-erythritol 4-phosphate cytidylyltransferase n=1 Tax=Pseudarthrobacter sp. J64 TaxID=3116485 RepID=UPI002E803A66|nr:2-C-methyl-D-erythritol 4-phosphate cytidylyltransferase [Pseudarthrobacter sp. J64]MEE2570942.1 2-C-methyl-D-erythritol 4-phosphate cytidylyltransferase [Pseudarthrobacter sp. J64]
MSTDNLAAAGSNGSADHLRPVMAAIVVAAGSGERLGYGIPKARVPLGEVSILTHALRGVAAAGIVRQICVAVPGDDPVLARICQEFADELREESDQPEGTLANPLVTVVDGGATRPDSVRSALAAVLEGTDAVLVHDAARALTPENVFKRVADALTAGATAVIPAVPVVDTIKTVTAASGTADAAVAPEVVTGTAAREELRAVQTPQGFALKTLLRAHESAALLDDAQAAAITDDAMLVESMGEPVYVVRGSTQSLKITTPLDLIIAEGLLEGPLGARWVEG